MAVMAGASVAAGFIDIEKFYDSLDPQILVTQLIRLQFPPVSLILHLQAHWGIRCIVQEGIASRLFAGTRSILAGCTSSNSLARAYLHHVCEDIVWQIPRVKLSTFVDDFVIWLVGAKTSLPQEMCRAIHVAYDAISKAKLNISTKSLVAASAIHIARSTANKLKLKYDIVLQVGASAKDLGIGTSLGSKRTAVVLTARRKKAQQKQRRAMVLKKALKSSAATFANKAWNTAIQPTLMYGAVAAGLGNKAMQDARVQAIKTIGLEMRGQSTTAALAIALGEHKDPAIQHPMAIIMQWLQLAHQFLQDMPGMASMWRLAVKHLKSKQRYKWHAVRGPMGAAIATLLDLQWDPTEWNEWIDAMGHTWKLTEQQDAVINAKTCDSLLRALRLDLQEQLWQNSTMQPLLQDKLPWLAGPRKQWLDYMKQHKYEEAKVLVRVVAGGLWTSQRVAAAASTMSSTTPPSSTTAQTTGSAQAGESSVEVVGPSDLDKQSPHCRLCGAPVQCEWHTAWECPSVLASDSLQASEALVQQARACRGHSEALWLRGLATDVYQQVPPPVQQEDTLVWPQQSWRPGKYYTDASGGRYADDPCLRRVGVSACCLTSSLNAEGNLDPDFSAFMQAPLVGESQTVNRGELYAIITVLELIDPQKGEFTTIVTDSQYCIDGDTAGQAKQSSTWNDDLWNRYFKQLERHEHRVVLVKVKSHMDIYDAMQGSILLEDLVGNAMADEGAKKAAAAAELHEKIASKVRGEQSGARKILRHLVTANLEYLRLLEAKGHRDPNQKLPQAPLQRRPPSTASSRGHKLQKVGPDRWKCMYCLSMRNSTRAHRWPSQCPQTFRLIPAASEPVAQSSAEFAQFCGEACGQSESTQSAQGSVPAGGAGSVLQQPGAQRCTLDDSEAEEPPQEELVLQRYEDPVDLRVVEECPAPPAPVLPAPPAQSVSWWSRLGELVAHSELRIGGAELHHSHRLAHFGNARHRLVFCLQCGGMTSGASSELLAASCRRSAGATRARQLRRMCLQGIWPEASQEASFGRAELSAAITFHPEGPLLRIAAAGPAAGPPA